MRPGRLNEEVCACVREEAVHPGQGRRPPREARWELQTRLGPGNSRRGGRATFREKLGRPRGRYAGGLLAVHACLPDF